MAFGRIFQTKEERRIAKMEKEKRERSKKVQELNEWLFLIPYSAKKTTIPQLAPLHRYLLRKSVAYYRWHLNPYAQITHWLSLFGTLFLLILVLFSSIPFLVKAEAKVWDGEGLTENWSDDLNWLPDGAPAAGDTVTFNSTNDKNVTIDNLGTWGSAGESLTITGDAGATDGYDGSISLTVAIPGMGAFAMAGANSIAAFSDGGNAITASSLSVAGGTFTSTGNTETTGNVDLSGGGLSVAVNLIVGGNFTQSGGTYNVLEVFGNRLSVTGNVDLTSGIFNDPSVLTISGNFTLNGATYNVGGTIALSGSWAFTSGSFNGANPSVTFNDSGKVSTISGSTTFENFTSITAAKQITFTDGTTQTITNLLLTGGAGANQIVLRSTTPGSQWEVDVVAAASVSVTYVDVKDSNSINGGTVTAITSTNSDNNTNWLFQIDITVFNNSGDNLNDTTIAINGGLPTSLVPATSDILAGANITFTMQHYFSDGDIITFYSGGAGEDVAIVTVATTTTNIADFTVSSLDTVTARHETAGPITNADFSTGEGGLAVPFSVAGSDLTLDAGVDFIVWTNKTYTPGGNLISDDVTIQAGANFNAETYTATLSGNWSNSGTFTPGSSTVEFNGTEIAVYTLNNGSSSFWHLTINLSGAGGSIALDTNNLDVDGNFRLQDGTFNANALNQNYAGGFTLDLGTGYTKGGALTFDGATDTAIYTDSTAATQNIGTVVIGGGAGKKITLASNMTVDTMLIDADNTLDLGSNSYVLDLKDVFLVPLPGHPAERDSLRVDGTLTPGTSTVKYSAVFGGGNMLVTNTTYNSLQVSGAETYVLLGNLTGANALTGNITIDNVSTLSADVVQNYGITLAGNWDNNWVFTPGSGTVTFNAAAGTQTIDNGPNSSFYNLTLSNAGIKQLDTNLLDVDGTFSLQGGTFDANGLSQVFSGDVELLANTTYTKGGTVTFNHGLGITYTDSNDTKQNIGTVRLLSAAAAPPDNQLTLLSSMTVDTMTINIDNVLDLNSNNYTLDLQGVLTAAVHGDGVGDSLIVIGTLTPGTSTVKYSGVIVGNNIEVTTTTYNSLQFSGAETYELLGNLTGGNALTGSLTIDSGATLDAVDGQNYNITLAGNWSNAGTFTPRSNTVTFNAGVGTQDLNSGGVGAGKSFNGLTHSGDGTLRLITNAVDIDGGFINSAGIFNANGQDMYVGGGSGWANSAIFTHGNNTVVFDYPGAPPPFPLLDPGASAFWNLTIDYTGGGMLTLANSPLDVDGNFRLQAGTFNTNALDQNYAGSFTLDADTTYTKGGTLTFDGATDTAIYTDSTAVKQDIGEVIIGGGVGKEITLASSMTVNSLDVSTTLNLGVGSYTLNLAGGSSGIWADPAEIAHVLRVTGTLNPGTSTVQYSGVNGAINITVTITPYSSLQLSGAETYILEGNHTGANALTGSLTIDNGATLDAVFGGDYNITLAGNWDNNGTFTPREGLVTFSAAAGTQALDSGGVGAGFLFNHLTHSGAGILQLTNNALDVDGNFLQSAGTFDTNALSQNYAGNFTLDAGTTYTKGGTLTFDGVEDNNYTDSTAVKQNIGAVVIGGGAGNELTLASSMTADIMTVNANNTLDLASNGYILNLANAGAVATVLTVNGTLTPGTNSTVQYSATNAAGNTTYNSIQFSGAETYVPVGNLTGANALTGSLTIDAAANLNADGKNITLGSNWTKNGIFSHSNNTVTFNDATQTSTISGNSTFWNFSCTTPGKTLAFQSDSTQTITSPASWEIAGAAGNNINLERAGGAGADQWNINPAAWNVDFVNVGNSVNQAALPIDPVHFVDNGNNINWFPAAVMTWCVKENAFIPQGEWTSARCDVPGGGGGPVNQWCEKEQQFIPQDEWTEERCAPDGTLWCEAEQQFIPEEEWSVDRCVPPPLTVWCEDEQRFIPQDEWTEERCVPEGAKWCEFEQHFIPEQDWTEERCTPPGTKWCGAEKQYIPIEQWTEGRCITPILKWCMKERQYIPEQDWTERRCVTDGARWCEVEQRYMPEEEWTVDRCVPPGTQWCEIEQEYISIEEWTEERCVPAVPEEEEEQKGIIDIVRGWLNSPAAEDTAKAIAMTGLIVSGLGLIGFIPISPANWGLQLLRLLSSLMIAFGLKRKSKGWGTVYDSITKQPLDPAYVMLQNEKGEEVTTSITDLDGRYGFLAEPGKYTMVANKTHYKFPSKALYGRSNDEIYSNLYFGGEVEVGEKGDVVARDIPLDREKFDWNEFAKKQKNLMKLYSQTEITFRQLADILFVVGFASAIVSVLLAPERANLIVVLLYMLLGVLISLNIKTRTFGTLSEKDTGLPLSFAILRIFNADVDKEMVKRVANQYGRYYILVPPGKYYLKIEKKNDDGSYSHIFTSKVMNVKSGVIQNRFAI
ncbi:MAG: hypothetical protein UR98_C0002G0026 [Parcubacteria group bacterium GW2011_GWA1_36_12]|nr:MAG: hypothetical protein UR98_C0002G0026 [Parcubacteria group bacterium GW2011_GWA1_36_12]